MKSLITISFYICLLFVVGCAGPDTPVVSIRELASGNGQYDGQFILVDGQAELVETTNSTDYCSTVNINLEIVWAETEIHGYTYLFKNHDDVVDLVIEQACSSRPLPEHTRLQVFGRWDEAEEIFILKSYQRKAVSDE